MKPLDDVVYLSEYRKIAKSNRQTYKILIAEDDPINRATLAKTLESEGFKVDSVENGDLALDEIEKTKYDLIILACDMPVMGGIEATKIYRALYAGEVYAPIIVLSEDTANCTVDEAMDAGVTAFISKPVNAELLCNTVLNILEDKSSSMESSTVLDFFSRSTSLPVDLPLVDFSRLNEFNILGGSRFTKSLIDAFFEEAEGIFIQLDSHVKKEDYTGVNRYGHSLLGVSAEVGAIRLTDSCRRLDKVKPSDSLKVIKKYVSEAIFTYELTKNAYLNSEYHQQNELLSES